MHIEFLLMVMCCRIHSFRSVRCRILGTLCGSTCTWHMKHGISDELL